LKNGAYGAVIVTENHLRFVIGRHIVSELKDTRIPTAPYASSQYSPARAPNSRTDLSHQCADVHHFVSKCGGDIAV